MLGDRKHQMRAVFVVQYSNVGLYIDSMGGPVIAQLELAGHVSSHEKEPPPNQMQKRCEIDPVDPVVRRALRLEIV